jgi:hypothetical protein
MGGTELASSQLPAKPDVPVPAFAKVGSADVAFAAVCITALALVASLLLIAAPLGDYFLPSGGFRFFPSVLQLHLVHRKPAEQMRYLLAVAFAFGLGLIFAHVRLPRALTATQAGCVGVRLASVGSQLAVVGVAVWGWWAQFHFSGGEPPTTHFNNGNLIAAIAVAGTLMLVVRLRPNWFGPRPFVVHRPERWIWFAIAVLLTVCWLLPSVFREQNLAPASLSVTYHLQFTFDDFVALVNGRTPLVNYTEQYASLLPFVVWPMFHLGGTQIGTFTTTMCLLSLVSLLAIQRTLALVTRNERLALVLYIPFLGTSLFFILRSGSQLFNWASYYAVFPMRYFGPYVLLWLSVRNLRGMRPRSLIIVFVFAGLVVLNNVEFGLPALGAATVAVILGSQPEPGRVMRLIKDAVLGLGGAWAAVSILTLLLAGQLPNFDLLTMYSRIFAEGGYGLLHTPVAGLYLIVNMTFVAAVLLAAVRYRRRAVDNVYTAALAYSGVFGLGVGNYYMGRTHPAGLVVLFSAWALSVVLLALLALRALAARHDRSRAPTLLLTGALVSLGLASTTVAQFPAPWTQLRRIASSAPPPPPYNISDAVSFLRRTAAPGEPIVLLAPLGHLIALDAGVENVSPYSHPDGVIAYQQLHDMFAALHNAGGKRFYTARSVFPEIPHTLANKGFVPTTDPTSGITEWLIPEKHGGLHSPKRERTTQPFSSP